MSPEPMPGPAFWASGGTILGRGGAAVRDPVALLGFLHRQAATRRANGAVAAALHCERRARALGAAIEEAQRWRRAAGGPLLASRAT